MMKASESNWIIDLINSRMSGSNIAITPKIISPIPKFIIFLSATNFQT